MVRVLAVLFAFLAIVSSQGEFFTVFPTGPPENFTQEIHGIDTVGSIFVGVAFVGDRVLVTNCDSNRGVLFSNSYDTTVLGNTMHSSTAVTFPYAGCNLINHPDGYLYYTQVSRGIIKLDPNNGFREAPIAGQLGGQGIYARLGMAVDPQNHDQIFFVSGSYIYILTLSTNKYRMLPGSAAGCHDGMYFNENGTLIVAADPCNNVVRIFRREGGQVAAVPIPGGPDGVAFHSCSNSAYVAVNDGTLWKIDMTTFAATRVASGGTRGDIGAVGPDGCFYLTFLGNTRFRAGVRYSNALVKICSSSCKFAITPGIPTSECGNGKLEDGEDCDGGGCCDTRTCKFLPSNTTCRASAGPCDVEEFCSGTNNTCPEDKFAPATTPCGEIFGMCDVIMKRTCPGDSVKCYGPPPIPALSFEGISWTDFNVISFDTFTCDAGDVEGRLAVKNKANLGDFTLGLQLKLATDSWKTTTLIVGGDAKWNSGSLHPDGSMDTVLIAGPAANAFVKGTYTAPDYLAERRHHSIDGVDPAPIFNAGKTYYQTVQSELASLPTNAEATLKYGDGVFIKCQSLSDVYHVKIDSAILSSGKWYSLSNCKFSASWIIDVTGTSNVTIQGQAFPGIVERVIYNVLGSGRFITGNTGVAGHILAPSNTFTATSGVTYGILIAGDIASIRQSNKPNCLTFRPVSIATKVTKPIAIGDKIIYVVDLAAFIAGDLVCVDSDCKKIISGEIRDIDGDGKLDHVITVDAAFAEKHDADGFLTTEVTDADQNRNTPLAVEPSITASTSESPFSEQDKPSFATSLAVAFATLAVVAVLIPLF